MGLTAEQLAAHEQRIEARQAAAGDPLPGPLLDAFFPAAMKVAGLELRPVVAYDLTFLKKIDSPLYRYLLELEKPLEERKVVAFEDDDIWEILFVLTRPPAEVARVLRQGREVFRAEALAVTAYVLPMVSRPLAEKAITEHFASAFATSVGYSPTPTEGGQVFTMPPAARPMGSAGG